MAQSKMEYIYEKRFVLLIRSIGFVYLWFGFLKFFPHTSAAENLAKITISHLTFGLIAPGISIVLLAIWETIIGICLVCNRINKIILIFTIIHMVFTFTPFIFLPALSYHSNILSPTLIGQYIIKNIIIVFALIVIYCERIYTPNIKEIENIQ